jgi:hypothetical protein
LAEEVQAVAQWAAVAVREVCFIMQRKPRQ